MKIPRNREWITDNGRYEPRHLEAECISEMLQVILKLQPWYNHYLFSRSMPLITALPTTPNELEFGKKSRAMRSRVQDFYDKYASQNLEAIENDYWKAIEDYYERCALEDQKAAQAQEAKSAQLSRLKSIKEKSLMNSKSKRKVAFNELKDQLKSIANSTTGKPSICVDATKAAVSSACNLRSTISADAFPASWRQTIAFLNSAYPLLKIPSKQTYHSYIKKHHEHIMSPDQNYLANDVEGIWVELFGNFL